VLNRVVAGGSGWQTWITEGLADLFETPAGMEIRLRQRHAMDPQHGESIFASDAGEITLGRDEGCAIRLAPRSVGNRHARIFTRAGRCYIEDLGSALGTFLNESRLPANQPAPVSTGDQFAIFPYTFTVELTERWVRGVPVEVRAGPVAPLSGAAFHAPVAVDGQRLAIQLQPSAAVFMLEASRSFLERLSAQLLAPVCPQVSARLGLTTVDTGFLEFLISAVIERVNRDLQFPLQAMLAPACPLPVYRADECGLTCSFSIRIGELTGTFRLCLSDHAVESLAYSIAPQNSPAIPQVSWAFPLSAGHVELTGTETALIEPADVVLLTREMALLFPNAPERGWRLQPRAGNLSQAIVDKYFERDCLTERESAGPDLAGLPVRMHAIIGEKEMTLAEASLLAAGGIVELDGAKSDPVRIALNGKIAGTGELVEVEGRLGVRILAWRAP
jgi:flagellar motor switch/type III secretory pathway protein FliN